MPTKTWKEAIAEDPKMRFVRAEEGGLYRPEKFSVRCDCGRVLFFYATDLRPNTCVGCGRTTTVEINVTIKEA